MAPVWASTLSLQQRSLMLFNPLKVPRTMTREEWRDLDRWRRMTQCDPDDMRDRILQRIVDYHIFNLSQPDRIDTAAMMGRIIDIHGFMGPYQE
jgi:hypothetical protein